jgi:aryl-alcohol dehydrogenase-like predicted oxidoreductase
MKYTKLGKNGALISTVGFGAWGISGLDWGVTDDNLSKKALHHAFDNGVTFIDTADTYGFGHSEDLIAAVLKERGGKRNIVIATKAGNNFYPYIGKEDKITPLNPNYTIEYLIEAVEKSLRRLQIDALDIIQLHSPSKQYLDMDEPWMALEMLKKQGKIIQAGWSVQSFKETEQAYVLDEHHQILDCIQVRYNLLEREAEKVLFPKAQQYNIGVIARIPILFGLLAGKFDRSTTFTDNDHRHIHLSPEKLSHYFDSLDQLAPVFEKYPNYSKAQISLRFCLSHPAVHVVIPGTKTSQQVDDNIVASDLDWIKFNDFPIF